MTIGELELVLAAHNNKDTPVVAEWDSGWSKMDRTELQKDQKGNNILVFDVSD